MTSLRRSAGRGPLGAGKTVSLLQTKKLRPRHVTVSAAPRQPLSPDPSRSLPEFLEAEEVANNPVIPVVAAQLLRELLVLLPERKVQVLAAPFRQRGERALESAVRRPPFDYPCASLGSALVVGESQEVECRRCGLVPSLGFGVVGLGRFEPHQTRLLRVDRQAVLAHPLG